jgi:hypothetical protein
MRSFIAIALVMCAALARQAAGNSGCVNGYAPADGCWLGEWDYNGWSTLERVTTPCSEIMSTGKPWCMMPIYQAGF